MLLDKVLGGNNRLVDNTQKGFLPMPGAEEHAFVMRVLFEEECKDKELLAWFVDVKGAYDTVPHDVLLSMLRDKCVGGSQNMFFKIVWSVVG